MTFTNLYIGYNKIEDFRILICAFDEVEAQELADEYMVDSGFIGTFEISEPTDGIDNIHFDCDYVIAQTGPIKKDQALCPRCGHALSKSDLEEYKYLCRNCDENFYEMEVKYEI